MKNLVIKVAFCCLVFFALNKPSAHAVDAYLLDTAGVVNSEELYLIGALQGIVNRDAPRLFLSRTRNNTTSGADNTFAQYLQLQKGYNFTRFRTLNDAIAFFAMQKRADGVTPLIKGMVKYQPSYYDPSINAVVNKQHNYWVAANFAAQEDLLPVTDNILANTTPALSGRSFWYKDTAMTGWSSFFTSSTLGANGLAVTGNSSAARCAEFNSCNTKLVDLDLNVTPKVEIVVSALSPGGIWSLGIDMGSTINTFANQDSTHVPALTNVTTSGTFTVDLLASGLFNPTAGLATLRICAMTPGTTVTVKSIRFLNANGNDPTIPLYVPPTTQFSTLAMLRDLTNSGLYPQLSDAASAATWSINNQFPLCNKDQLAIPEGTWYSMGMVDHAIANKHFMYYEDVTLFADPASRLDNILSALNPNARIAGAIGQGEDFLVAKISQYGLRQVVPTANFSFWQWVPAAGTQLPQVRHVPALENKIYVNIGEASGDVINQPAALMSGYWGDPNRGTLPVTWGLNPALAEISQAFVEYFASTATPYDSFWAGPSGAGYAHPSTMLPVDLDGFATITRQGIAALGMSPAVDLWDVGNAASTKAAFTTGTSPPPIGLLTTLPVEWGSNSWMEDGTPVIVPASAVFGQFENDYETTPQIMADAIQSVANAHPEAGTVKGPFFLSCNIRFSPTFYKSVRDLLPSDKFTLVGMPDFIGLSQEAGAFVVVPYTTGVGSGDNIKVSIELHNVAGTTGGAGTVSWILPAGWSSSPTSWTHGTVPVKGNLKQVVTFTPPAGITNGTATIKFSDSRYSWNRTLLINTYPQGGTVTDCASTAGWIATSGASVSMDNGMVKILPLQGLRRSEYLSGTQIANNGRASLSMGWVDLDRQPYLEINLADQNSNYTRIGVSSNVSSKILLYADGNKSNVLDLAGLTSWTGAQTLTLTVDPVTAYGTYVRARAVKLHYATPQPTPVTASSGTVNLGASKYAVINGGTLYADPAQGTTVLNSLKVATSGALSLAPNLTLSASQLSGGGTLTITGNSAWGKGLNLQAGDNSAFTGKIVVINTWLWGDNLSLGAVPPFYTADSITINNGTLVLTGPIATNRGVTLGTGTPSIFGSVATLNNKFTGTGKLNVRGSTLTLNAVNDFAGPFGTWSSTTVMSVDNALPHGTGKGNLTFLDWDGGSSGSTIDLNGHVLTINGITSTAISGGSNIDNKAAGPATLVVGDNNAGGSYNGVIKNTGGPLSLKKIGTGTLTLSGINTYTGGTYLNQGIVSVSSLANSLGSGANGSVFFDGGTLLVTQASNFTATWPMTIGTQGGALQTGGAGRWYFGANTLDGSGTLTLNAGGANRFASYGSPQNNFSGKWVIGAVLFDFPEGDVWGTRTGDDAITLNGTTLVGMGGTIGSTTKGITLAGGSTLAMSGNSNSGDLMSSKISGTGALTLRPFANATKTCAITLANPTNAWIGGLTVTEADGTNASTAVILGADEVIPHGAGRGNVALGGTFAFLDMNGKAETINGLVGSGKIDNKASGAASLTVGDNNATATFAGTITNTAGNLSLIKVGTGTQTLSGALSYTGVTTVQAGYLQITGNVTLPTGSTYGATVNGNTAGTQYGQLKVTGTVNLNDASLSLAGSGGTSIVTLIDNDGTDAVIGTFAGLPQGAFITIGAVNYTISYTGGTGNDVTLSPL